MDNVGIVVDDLAATIEFFRELGLELEGRATIEGEWAGRVTGLGDQRVEIAMMRRPSDIARPALLGRNPSGFARGVGELVRTDSQLASRPVERFARRLGCALL